jgi:hypothetical protein
MKGSGSVAWVAIAVVLLALWQAWPKRMTWVRSAVTGKMYKVKNVPDAQTVADRLAALEVRLVQFLKDASARAPGDARLANIRKRWDGTLSEVEHDKDVAYSMAKDSVSVCVRSSAQGALESENTSMFVLLHELAHVATDEYGHCSKFWDNMKFLLEIAEATGFYAYQDFEASSDSYCGRPLESSPLTCVKTGACTSSLAGSK